jgi:hypothetical protein
MPVVPLLKPGMTPDPTVKGSVYVGLVFQEESNS